MFTRTLIHTSLTQRFLGDINHSMSASHLICSFKLCSVRHSCFARDFQSGGFESYSHRTLTSSSYRHAHHMRVSGNLILASDIFEIDT